MFDSLRGICLLFLSSTLLLAAGCSPSDKQRVLLSGSSTIAPLMQELGRTFEKKHPGIQVNVQAGGSSRGVHDAREGLVDIGMVSRPLREDEKGLIPITIARDGIAMIVHSANPLESITSEQVRALYTGRLTDWSGLDAGPGPVTLVHKAEGHSTGELFLEYFRLDRNEVQPDVVIGSNQQGIKTVAGNADAIGYVSVGTAEFEASQGRAIKLLALDGVEASMQTVAAGDYPFARPLNLVIPKEKEPEGAVRQFLDFVRSPEAAPVIRDQYFTPVAGQGGS